MDQRLRNSAKRYTSRQKRKRIWKNIVSFLGCVVVFCTTYTLILPAITLDKGPECGIEEHQHDSSCYLLSETVQTLICQLPEVEGHIHNDGCYEIIEEYVCGMDEIPGHTHEENCYTDSEILICERDETESHGHNEECYNEEDQLVCELGESEGHSHDDSCFANERVLVCSLEEVEGHIHSEACAGGESSLVCTLEELEGHAHGESCYERSESVLILICEKVEHIHTKACVSEEESQAVESESMSGESQAAESESVSGESQAAESESASREGQLAESESASGESQVAESESADNAGNELSEHELMGNGENKLEESTLSSASPSNAQREEEESIEAATPPNATSSNAQRSEADPIEISTSSNATEVTETSEDWEAELAELSLEELGDWTERLLAIAKSQIGYSESDENYIIEESGIEKGYTRYGDWYGEPYADWNTMFLAFCLSYAEIPDEEFPFTEEPETWVELLKEYELFHADYSLLKPGDMIFFDHNKDEIADHVGLVKSIEKDGTIKTIEGDIDNAVQVLSYMSGDSRILGFGAVPKMKELPAAAKEFEKITLTADVYQDATYSERMEDSLVITISGYMPDGVTAKAYPVEVQIAGFTVICAYDISLYLEDGTLYEPAEENAVTVSFQADNFPQAQDEDMSIHYVPESGPPTQVEAANVLEDGITFQADHFSVYAVTSARSITAGNNILIYNEQVDAFIRDGAYSKYYNSNSPIGTAGSFHIVGFGEVTLSTHTNGNILANTLYANSNFGTNNYPDELSYVLNYEKIAHTSASMTNHILAFGHNNQVTLVNNRNQFAVNGTQIDKPYNLIQDVNSEDAPFIDLERVEAEIRQISDNISEYSTVAKANGITYLPRTGNMQESVLELDRPDGVGAITFKASELYNNLSHSVQLTGFESGYDGTMIINIDCSEVTNVNMPKALIYIDGKVQGTSEVTQFDNGKVIWNFINAEGVTIEAQQMTGMIVAPGATVNINQNLNGTVVAENVNVRAESHRTDFTGRIVEPDVETDEREYYITVQKTEMGYTGTTLPGAEFDLYAYKDNTWQKINSVPLVTGEKGLVVLRHLETDIAYKLTEIKAPHGYKLAEDEFLFWVRSSITVTQPTWVPERFDVTSLSQGGTMIVANERLKGDETISLTINKVWLTYNGEEIETPEVDTIYAKIFQIPNGDDSLKTEYKLIQLTAENGWTANIDNLPVVHIAADGTQITYTYQVEELALEQYEITYLREDNIITIINTQMPYFYELPETGGIGTYWYMIYGSLLMAFAVIKGYGRRSKRERRLKE